MDSRSYWQLFMDTGAPEMYLMYQKARRMEDAHVLDNQRAGTPGVSLQ